MTDITGDGINDFDITTAGSSVTIGGVIFTDAVNVGSGTGNYNTFLAISNNSGVETGFNSDDTPPIDNTNSDIDQAKTHTVKLSDLVIVTVGGVQYYQVRVDLNEANSDPNAQISLDTFKIYTSTNGGIVSTTDLFANATLKYNMDAGGDVSVLLSDAESSGSGTDDYSVLIPVSTFAGQDPTTTFVYFDIKMGAAGTDWTANATFEEWNLENGVGLTGTKFEDANGNGIKDAGEGPVAGVTIFIDSNQNGTLDAGERSTVTDANGNYTFYGVALNQTLWIDEVVPVGSTQTTGDHETITIPLNITPGTILTVDPIGNFIPHPSMNVTKAVSSITGGQGTNGLDGADSDGDVIHYAISVQNTGNVALTGLTVTDPNADAGSIQPVTSGGFNTGDTDHDNVFDAGETWNFTATHTVTQPELDGKGIDIAGAIDGDGDDDNRVTADTNETAPDTADAAAPLIFNPHITVDKTASVDGDCADVANELITYSISVTNDGNVTLDTVNVTDPMADAGSILGVDVDNDTFNDGDTDADGKLDVGETWLYTATHTVTQDEIDAGGNYDSSDPADGINDSLRNVATATAEVVGTDTQVTDDDDAVVEVCQNLGIDLEKYVAVDSTDGTDGTFVDADDALGPQNVNLGADVWFKVTVENTGNVTLTDVDISDVNQTGGGSINFDLMQNGLLTADALANHSASLDGDTDNDGELDVGETWTITYRQPFDPGEHVNTATVTTHENQTDSDAAHYFSLVDEGLCPRTPGFWQNPNNGGQFWDGVAGNEKHAGENGFPDGELLYAVDSNHDGVINGSDAKGLLVGDYNKNGLTDVDEDTLFVSYADAQTLINASAKQLNVASGDGRYMLGRDMVASWLNYLQGSGFGDASDPQSPHHYLDDTIDWMQIFVGTNSGGTTETFDKLKLSGAAIKTNTATWNTPQSGIDHSASQMHSALDYYNNTGQTQPGGTHYANCESQHLFEALSIYQESHSLV
jgi:SdrD B-like domain